METGRAICEPILIRLDCLNYFLIWYNSSRFDLIKVFYKSLFSSCSVDHTVLFLTLRFILLLFLALTLLWSIKWHLKQICNSQGKHLTINRIGHNDIHSRECVVEYDQKRPADHKSFPFPFEVRNRNIAF